MGRAQERTRRQILAAFLELLTAKPYDMISVSEIAEASYVTRSTFYRYFDDKQTLLMTEIQETVELTAPDQPLLAQFVSYVDQYWQVLRHLAPTRQSRSDIHTMLNQIMWELIHQRVENGQANDPTVNLIRHAKDQSVMTSVIEGMMMGIVERYISQGVTKINRKELQSAVDELAEMFENNMK